MKFQYKVVPATYSPGGSGVEFLLNQEASEGWRFISVILVAELPSLLVFEKEES
jgi:hypothetical protein